MKYESVVYYNLNGCVINCVIKALDVLAFRHVPSILLKRVVGYSLLSDEEKDDIWIEILKIIETTDEEIETIESVAAAVAKGLTVEVENGLLARWAFGVCNVYINSVNSDGLLQNVDWANLPYWMFLVLVNLQKNTIKEANNRKKGV